MLEASDCCLGGEGRLPGGVTDDSAGLVAAVAELLDGCFGEDVGVVVPLVERMKFEGDRLAVGLSEEGCDACLVRGIEEGGRGAARRAKGAGSSGGRHCEEFLSKSQPAMD